MTILKYIGPGLLLALFIAMPATFLGNHMPLIGGPVFGIVGGIIISQVIPLPNRFRAGISFASKRILQSAIVFLGFGMNLTHIFAVGANSFFLILSVIITALVMTKIVSIIFKINQNTTVLIGVGTAICGGSAIAATAPILKAQEEEVAISISTIFLFNILAVLTFPTLGRLMGMTDVSFGLWAGTAINDTSSVVAAGQVWGEEALQTATIVKLVRTLMIIPISLFLAFKQTQKNAENVSIRKIFPWFILLFLLASFIASTNFMSADTSKILSGAGRFQITLAMTAIGLNTNIRNLITYGSKPIIMGMVAWVSVSIVSLYIQQFIQK
ncbi:YeiH family protein [Tindallia californiensis]|uniref:Conserved hypothetical integral membrane protein n=1 Tax=Tindallia californiensis TaxID=159292 RepID=A0A1H3ILA5_9FIRM|nr:YeiH family protein [Tindallia californiensis]SDY28480.1 conserved hypothetical integral membrane protein [Tindallia californiensis]